MNINRQNYQEINIVRKPNYLNEKALPPLLTKISNIVFIILLMTGNASASTRPPVSLDDEIIEAELIIKGELVNSFYLSENKPSNMRDVDNGLLGTRTPSVFTAYIFNVEEVLKGEYKKENIKVLMLGGCDYEFDMCVDYGFTYHYEVGEQAVLFLVKKANVPGAPDAYKAAREDSSAFYIKNNDVIIRKSSGEDDYEEGYSNKNKMENKLTLESLRIKISEWKDNNKK